MTQPPDLDWTGLDAPPDDEPDTRQRPVGVLLNTPPEPGLDPDCKARRDLVLRHPDIAARLTQPPLRYSRPDTWRGWIPPDMWREKWNDSPQRKALLEIVAAAMEAEKEGTA